MNMTTDSATAQQVAYDFKGNLLGSSRHFAQDEIRLPNWAQVTADASWPRSSYTRTQYDALNRVTGITAPDGSVVPGQPTTRPACCAR